MTRGTRRKRGRSRQDGRAVSQGEEDGLMNRKQALLPEAQDDRGRVTKTITEKTEQREPCEKLRERFMSRRWAAAFPAVADDFP